jgi:hypothetical protein
MQRTENRQVVVCVMASFFFLFSPTPSLGPLRHTHSHNQGRKFFFFCPNFYSCADIQAIRPRLCRRKRGPFCVVRRQWQAALRDAGGKGPLKKKKKNKEGESVGCFCVGLRFFGLFCKNLLHVILTPPARYQHPHDANNPQVGHWGNYEPKWWPQGSTSSSSKTKQRTHKR